MFFPSTTWNELSKSIEFGFLSPSPYDSPFPGHNKSLFQHNKCSYCLQFPHFLLSSVVLLPLFFLSQSYQWPIEKVHGKNQLSLLLLFFPLWHRFYNKMNLSRNHGNRLESCDLQKSAKWFLAKFLIFIHFYFERCFWSSIILRRKRIELFSLQH